MKTKLSHVRVNVKNIDEALNWYTTVLELADIYLNRINTKNWKATWNRLKVHYINGVK